MHIYIHIPIYININIYRQYTYKTYKPWQNRTYMEPQTHPIKFLGMLTTWDQVFKELNSLDINIG